MHMPGWTQLGTGPPLDIGLWRPYIAECAARCSRSYDEREDLISDTVRALLEYKEHIEHPRSFIKTTVRHIAINRGCIGADAREFCDTELADELRIHAGATEPSSSLIIRDTLERLLECLTPAEARCYETLEAGYEQRDLPGKLGISRQAVSKLLAGIRGKYEALEAEDASQE